MTTRKIKVYDSSLITGSSDMLRQAIGGYYEIAIPTDSDGTPIDSNRVLQYRPPEDSSVYLGSTKFTPISTDLPASSMIDGIAVYPITITTASEESMFPFYTVPVSIMGSGPSLAPDEATTGIEDLAEIMNSDQRWKAYILGGPFSETEYPGIYNSSTFEVNSFSYDAPYDLLYAKTISDTYSSYQTIEKKSVYNMYLPSYQNYNATVNEKDMLNIYDLIQCSVLDPNSAYPDAKEQVTIGNTVDFNSENIFEDSPTVAPALIKTIERIPSDPATDPTIYVDPYEKVREYYYKFSAGSPESTADNSTMSNILFTKLDIDGLFGEAYNYAEAHGGYYPFYNKIGLPALGAGAINSTIVKTDFSAILLKSIRDAFVSGLYKTGEKSFVSELEEDASSDSGALYESARVFNTTAKYVDFKSILAQLNNDSKAVFTDPVRFAGEARHSNRAAINYSGELTHINKKNNSEMLAAIQDGLLSLSPAWTSLPAGVSPNTYMPWSNTTGFNINEFMSLSDESRTNEAECVALRINKLNVATGEEFNYMIQNQPQNIGADGTYSPEDINSDSWCYYDAQVKYGETYRYTTYAYFMVIGYRYEYSDLTLSRRISEYGQYESEAGGETTYKTCIEFYDPLTGNAQPSVMKTVDGNMEPTRTNLVNVATEEGYATTAQELAHGRKINWADFNLKIEPTIKIIEVPIGDAKDLTVLDNPPPKLDVIPYQVKDQTQSIGFYIKLENSPVKEEKSRTCLYPTPINDEERFNYVRYLTSQNMLDTEKLKYGTISRATAVQVYRLGSKPDSMSDFEGNLVATKNLIIADKNDKDHRTYITPTCFHEERISTGHKFYYAFRFVSENNTPSPWSHVVEAELIDDGGYKYTNFNNIMEYELGGGTKYDQPFTQFKKLLLLRPAIPQLDIDSIGIDYEDTANNQFNNVKLADALSDSIWNKTYKIRLTSKKTGQKIDLNVNYKLVESSE